MARTDTNNAGSHPQRGMYGPSDNGGTGLRRLRACALLIALWLTLFCGAPADRHIPGGLHSIHAKDGSVWEQVCTPGFGNQNNFSVVAMEEYKGRLYALTRNDNQGAELWRTASSTWEQVVFPGGATNGIYGNVFINNLFADMIVFQGKLYVGFSSGFQGGTRKSTGCEIWRFDGRSWEPVISDKKDTEESGVITAIDGCAVDDGDVTARIRDASRQWKPDCWAGGVLQITSGAGIFRRFDIVSNTGDTLVIQKNELSGETGTEFTICGSVHYKNPFPPYEYDSGAVKVGDSYTIGTGYDENGFGDFWNRALHCMVIFNDRLYVGTGLNYEYGSEVWYTADGDSWQVTQPRNSFNVFHQDPTFPNARKPVVVTALSLCASSVSGTNVLYCGGTGSTGSAGRCARMAKLTPGGWELIVDAHVDANDTGTNENGFGDGMACTMFDGNFMPWSLADFKNRLYVGINTVGGARVLFTPNGRSQDGSWFYSAGGDSGIPNGFDGKLNQGMTAALKKDCYKNIVANIYATKDYLYAGLVSSYVPSLGGTKQNLTGAQLWKTPDGSTWQQVISDGFGDHTITTIQAFVEFGGALYLAGSKSANSMIGGLGGAKIFRLAQ